MTTSPADVAPGQTSWRSLVLAMSGCTACPLAGSRNLVVPGVCPQRPRLLLVGEAPGAAEDAGGLPFVGRSGQLLDSMLAEAGIDRRAAAVCNVVKCRPPRNRPPRRLEAATCRPWLDRQVELADPEVVVTLGSTALSWALGPAARIGRVHGCVHPLGGRALVPTYHPAAALRFGPAGEPHAALRADLRVVARLLDRSADG
jgi:uracil-DNA glycosylase